MNIDILSPDLFYKHKYVKHTELNGLVLFHYTQDCIFDRSWDDITLNARGIIFNKVTKELIAKPWSKFFNIGETPYTNIKELEKLGKFHTTVKVDGSLGILYKHNSEWFITTKGSLNSDQGIWATKWARENMDLSTIDNHYTYLFEIIYPENRIVIDYKGFRGLILLGMVNKESGKEVNYKILQQYATKIKVKCVMQFACNNLNDLVDYCKTLTSSQEGFVITFSNGFKVKIKGDEYLKIHKIISNLTPLAFWEAWDINGKCIPPWYLQQIPEEFRNFTDKTSKSIKQIHDDLYAQIMEEWYEIMWDGKVPYKVRQMTIKDFAIECQKNHKVNMSLLINIFKKQEDKMWNSIHQRVRPTANILPKTCKINYDIHGRINRVLIDDN